MMERTIVLKEWTAKSESGELFTVIESQTFITENLNSKEKALCKTLRTDKGYYVSKINSKTFVLLQSGEILKVVS
jgi:hypothetical protein